MPTTNFLALGLKNIMDEHRNREKKDYFSSHFFFKYKNYINSEVLETQCAMLEMFRPWNQRPNFVRPRAKPFSFLISKTDKYA